MRKHINRLGVRTASALVAMAFAAQAAWALAPFKVQDIRVEGLQRVEPGTIFASLPLRVGDEYNDEKGAAAIDAYTKAAQAPDQNGKSPLEAAFAEGGALSSPLAKAGLVGLAAVIGSSVLQGGRR